MKKLALIGAMNRDLVAIGCGAEVIAQLDLSAEALVETAVSDETAGRGAQHLMERGAQSYLGGSAFNVARVIGLLNMRQAYVEGHFIGLAGAVDGHWPHGESLDGWAIKRELVHRADAPPATCLAVIEGQGRTLLTALGANAQIADYLSAERESIIAKLAACDVVHITSFLDASVPALLAEIVAAAKEINPSLKLSIDPGAAWVFPGGKGLEALLAQTNILHLNHEELAHLLRSEARGITSLGSMLDARGWMIVSRHHEWVEVIEGQGGEVTARCALEKVVDPIQVVDANGAGDTFCGAFLWAWLGGAMPIDAARFGFSCARAKVSVSGPVTLADLPK